MKVYLESVDHPWVTWDADLWMADSGHKIITSVESDADKRVVEWNPNEIQSADAYIIDSISDHDLTSFAIATNTTFPRPLILSNSIDVINRCKARDLPVEFWSKPTRVPARLAYNKPLDTTAKTGGFVVVSNGSRAEDNLAEILKTYFAMCLEDDPENEGELVCMQDVDIFSAYDLPFETFNNINFHGLQPNPRMFKTIRNAKLFISPYNGDGVPMNAIDAVVLGTPIIVRDTEVNREFFNWDDRHFYANEKELAQKIKYFSDIPTDDEDYQTRIFDAFQALFPVVSPHVSLDNLLFILKGG